MGPRPHLSLSACKTTWLASESLVFMGPSPLICGFCVQKSDFRTRITSLYRFQTSPMFFWIQNSDFNTRIASLYGTQPSSVVLCIHNSDFSIRNTSLYGSQPASVVLWMQNNESSIRITSLYGSQPSSVVFACKSAILDQNYKSLRDPDLTYVCFFIHNSV